MSAYPFEFWLAVCLLLGLGAHAAYNWHKPGSIPALAVYATVGFWYLGDICYNGVDTYHELFPPPTIAAALFQVVVFLVAFTLFLGPLARSFCRNVGLPHDGDAHAKEERVRAHFQAGMDRAFPWIVGAWAVLVAIALVRVGFHVLAYLFPPLAGYSVNPWVRARVGGGLSFLISTASYLYTCLSAFFGIFLALSEKRSLRFKSLLLVLVAWPTYFFGRSRNVMLAVLMPGLIGYLFLGKASWLKKGIVASTVLLCLHVWLLFIAGARTYGVTQVFTSHDQTMAQASAQKHLGLNMFEELCWITTLIDDGSYTINWGRRYFAELANVVPRSLWKGKPYIGIDYAVARGQGGGAESQAGVHATISTGMIGQGVVNFGPLLGPLAAALLMALWAAFLSRLWRQRESFLRAGLFMLGIGLTFNAGRDITLLVFYPFLFGYLGIRVYEKHVDRGQPTPNRSKHSSRSSRSRHRSGPRPKVPHF